jgi:hypothetical protein
VRNQFGYGVRLQGSWSHVPVEVREEMESDAGQYGRPLALFPYPHSMVAVDHHP